MFVLWRKHTRALISTCLEWGVKLSNNRVVSIRQFMQDNGSRPGSLFFEHLPLRRLHKSSLDIEQT